MNKFKIYYNKETIELEAGSSYEAQCKGVEHFQKFTRKKIKGWDVSVQSLKSIENGDFMFA